MGLTTTLVMKSIWKILSEMFWLIRIDNSHYRLISKLGKEMQGKEHKRGKEHTKMSTITKFGCEML